MSHFKLCNDCDKDAKGVSKKVNIYFSLKKRKENNGYIRNQCECEPIRIQAYVDHGHP